MEVAVPIVVHGHLVAVVMTGQFLVGSPEVKAEQIIAAESNWRADAAHRMASDPVLHKHSGALAEAAKAPHVPFPREGKQAEDWWDKLTVATSEGDLQKLHGPLRQDVHHIADVAQIRYYQRRQLVESAFRTELTGTLSEFLAKDMSLPSILQKVLARMRDFWAFDNAFVLTGAEWQESVTLFATDSEALKQDADAPGSMYPLGEESGTRGVFLPPEGVPLEKAEDHDVEHWRGFLREIADAHGDVKWDARQATFIAVVKADSRNYIFCFNGRQEENVSPLPFRSQLADTTTRDGRIQRTRLSEECREQVLRTCQHVSNKLHLFWQAHEQELAYRAFSHTLRSPVARMTNPAASFGGLIEKHSARLIQEFRELYDAARHFLRAVAIGRREVDSELNKLTLVGNLDGLLATAKEDKTDLGQMLRELRKDYDFIAKRSGKTWKVDGELPKHAEIVGEEALIDLAVRNVAENAYKYSFNRRPIMVSLEETDTQRVLRLVNQGVPIAEGEESKVFEKNYRGIYARKRQGRAEEGTGLGMYLVKRIMEAVGGQVHVKCRLIHGGPRPEGKVTTTLMFPKTL